MSSNHALWARLVSLKCFGKQEWVKEFIGISAETILKKESKQQFQEIENNQHGEIEYTVQMRIRNERSLQVWYLNSS